MKMENNKSIWDILRQIFDLFSRKSTIPPKANSDLSKVAKTEPRPEPPAMEDKSVAEQPQWHRPIRADKFRPTQRFLNPDPIYKITGHHPGTDYGTQGEDSVPLHFCADGEVIESGLHQAFGNYFFYYVPVVDRTFVYFHLRDEAPARGQYKVGQQCGITGATGMSEGVHLHLECMKGRRTSSDRARLYTSKDALAEAAEDADTFIRSRITLS